MYTYERTLIQEERLSRGTDHCGSDGPVYELSTLVRAGRVCHPRDPAVPLDGTIIFAVNDKQTCHVGFDGVRGRASAVKHETLFHNADVMAAGEFVVENGIVTDVNDRSGSYGTYGMLQADAAFRSAVLDSLDASGVPMSASVRERLERK